ncbi:MAG: YSC84-related protein [Desulfobacterales bacterium]|jgi:lipid-binding SYLF domain-containing protein
MKSGTFLSNRKFSTILCLMFMVLLLFAGQSFAKKTAKEVDTSVDAAMERFHKQVKDAKEVVAKAKGLLILPNVKKGALIVGGEYGQGALKIGGKTVDYYSMISGSFGLQIGGQAKDIIIAFNSSEALKKFRESKGWEAGVDGNVALIKMGAGESAVAAMAKQPIAAFVFDVKGLIADMSLKGAKFNKLDKTK